MYQDFCGSWGLEGDARKAGAAAAAKIADSGRPINRNGGNFIGLRTHISFANSEKKLKLTKITGDLTWGFFWFPLSFLIPSWQTFPQSPLRSFLKPIIRSIFLYNFCFSKGNIKLIVFWNATTTGYDFASRETILVLILTSAAQWAYGRHTTESGRHVRPRWRYQKFKRHPSVHGYNESTSRIVSC